MKNFLRLARQIRLPLKQLSPLFLALILYTLLQASAPSTLLSQSTGGSSESHIGKAADKNPDIHIKQLIASLHNDWPDSKKQKVSAVLPFYRQSIENSNAFGTYLAETCSDLMVSEHRLKVVSRSRLRNFIEELEFQQDELVQKSTRKELGQFLGADYIIIGNFWYMGEVIKVSVRVYDVESAYALTAASVFIPTKNVPEDFLTEIENDRQLDKATSEGLRKQKLEEIARLEAKRKKALEKKTILSISTIPEDSIVSIEGISIPKAKLVNMEVSPGDYLISVIAEGFKPSRETILVEKGKHRVLAIKLIKEEKALIFDGKRTNPRKTFNGGSWSPENTKPSKGHSNPQRTEYNSYSDKDKAPIVNEYRTYKFYITMLRKQYSHIKNLEMTIDDVPLTNLRLVNDMAHSSTLFRRTYSCSVKLKNGQRRLNFAGKLRTGFFTFSFARERWVPINNQTSSNIKIKLGAIKGY